MEQFRADLHIHSRFSRATSKSLNPRTLAAWAGVKGIKLLGTGDFTHPEWLDELETHLVEDGAGLLKLARTGDLSKEVAWTGYDPSPRVRFMLQAEISSIYKRGGKVRKVHNLVYVPDFGSARALQTKLAEIGNIASDGRPILGLDSRDLLEMVLELHPLAFLVPAHIWTPWFSVFGSKSGFDSLEECFGDLAPEVFALETGLSSDPEMNRMWSALDRFRLVSNSDAHSGEKLGREVNLFSGDVSYEGIYRALRGEGLAHKFLGTVEFFPEEGKYHLDGHRKCGVVLEPRDTRARGGLCPVCGKPLTVGVLSRVLELADRDAPVEPQGQPGFISLVPLAEILSEVLGVGPNTKKVKELYAKLLRRVGPEMDILQSVPVEDVRTAHPLVGEAVARMRKGKVMRDPGFDGQFGVIRVFSEAERKEMKQGRFLAASPQTPARSRQAALSLPDKTGKPVAAPPPFSFNDAQRLAIAAGPGPVLVVAGPGSGKTRTLIGRIEALLDEGENPRNILAVTFTRRAAGELRERLLAARGEESALPRADTLHALAFEVWRNAYGEAPVVMNEEAARRVFAECHPELSPARLKTAWREVNLARERLDISEPARELLHPYVKRKESWNLVDYTDLLEFWLEQIESEIYANPFVHVLVDEAQDLSALQLSVIKQMIGGRGRGFFAIGDPDQSIYGFRGATGRVREDLERFWPDLTVVTLAENYRSGPSILRAGAGLFGRDPMAAHSAEPGEILLFEAPSRASECSWIAERARSLLGSTSHTLADGGEAELSPGEIAVLVRFGALAVPIRQALERMGVPCSAPELEAFWLEPRVAAILRAAGSFLGMAVPGPEKDRSEAEIEVDLPERILAKGPIGLAAFLQDIAPFDRMFWEGPQFRRLAKAWDEHGGWVGLINWLNLQSELELVRRRAEKVQVMTMHAAKGLEFAAVFLPALEDGLLPFAGVDFLTGKTTEPAYDLDEERRLFYVALTRARQRLYLSHAGRRELYGRELQLKPSRFLSDLPDDLLSRSTLKARTVRQEKPLGLF
jgi:uncharacterized protein (TIGR00375 family)